MEDLKLSADDFQEEVISEITAPTESRPEVTPVISTDDFEKLPETKPSGNGSDKPDPEASEVKVKQKLPANFTAEIAVDTIDSVQDTVFTMLTIRKMKRRYFLDSEEYETARRVSYMSDEELAKDPNFANKSMLLARYKKFRSAVDKAMKEIPLTEGENKKLMKPVTFWVQQSGYDLPPSLGFFLALSQILVDRTADLIMD